MFSKYQENPSLDLDYLKKIVRTFTNALNRTTNLVKSKFEYIVMYKFLWKFIAEFMKLGYETFKTNT